MPVSDFLNKLKPRAEPVEHAEHTSNPSESEAERNATYDDSPVRYLTWRSFILGACASMGGFIFGYSTGQISGFETMGDFKRRFAQHKAATDSYYFSNVRSGLIVGLVSPI